MAKRVRYDNDNPIPKRIEYKASGATKDEQRLSSLEAAERLGVSQKTLVRWWRRVRFPGEQYEPDEEYKGGSMRLLWPVSVVERLADLLSDTRDIAGEPGKRRLPEVPWKAATKW